MFYRPWQTVRPDPARSAALSAALGMPRLVCDVMCARGLDTPEAARAVCGGGDALSDPMLLSGMEAAVARIHRAIDDGERIAVFGDYDVDGVTATALLYTYLDSAGADVYYKLPSRDDDGYGLSETAVDLMAAKGVSLIVTVDNGVSANAAIAHAKEQGVDVVVHEATLETAMEEKANSRGHSSTRQAAQLARDAGVGRLIVTHVSSRYDARGCASLLAECRHLFPACELAEDFTQVSV